MLLIVALLQSAGCDRGSLSCTSSTPSNQRKSFRGSANSRSDEVSDILVFTARTWKCLRMWGFINKMRYFSLVDLFAMSFHPKRGRLNEMGSHSKL